MADPLSLATSEPRLLLRELTRADASALYDLLQKNREHLTKHGDYQSEVSATSEWVETYLADPRDNNLRFGVWLDDELIGRVDLIPVEPPNWGIGLWLDGDHTGYGYASIACRAVIEYASKAWGASAIYAGVTHGNEKSVALLARLGFERVAELETYTRFCLQLD